MEDAPGMIDVKNSTDDVCLGYERTQLNTDWIGSIPLITTTASVV
jgi:hypothetical protein